MGRTSNYVNGYARECPSQGQMHKKGEVVNELPSIGSRVIVEHYNVKSKNVMAQEGYVLHTGYMDCFCRPRVYEVESYTHGIDAPFDTKNSVVLKTKIGESDLRQTIKTIEIVSGYLRLVQAPDEGAIGKNED